jgi:hypothetical protein
MYRQTPGRQVTLVMRGTREENSTRGRRQKKEKRKSNPEKGKIEVDDNRKE